MKFFSTFTVAAAMSVCLFSGCHSHSRARQAAQARAERNNQDHASEVGNGATGSRSRGALGSNDSGEDYYLALMTPDEVAILRARARTSGRSNFQLTDFLSPEERANLRRRDVNHRP